LACDKIHFLSEEEANMAEPRRPMIARPDDDGNARAAVEALVAELQEGWERRNAEIADRHLSADVAWGSPYGATVHDFDTLFAIHRRLKAENRGGTRARYEIDRVLPVSPDVIVAHVARFALDENGEPVRPGSDDDGAFSEMAMYVLVRRESDWWLAAGQNTPIRPGGAV
jgi:uncharacterized protein (TIGR02246 family)